MDELSAPLTIGRFARVTGLTPKALRIYDRMGILRPASVNSETGYRYYEVAQLDRAESVRVLREMEVPLDRIRELLDDPTGATMRELLVRHRDLMEQRLAHVSRLVDRLDGTLEQGHGLLTHDVALVDAPAQTVISRRRRIDVAGLDDSAALDAAELACEGELGARLAAVGLAPAGRPITLHYDVLSWYEHYDIEVCLPISGEAAAVLADKVWELPGGTLASTVHRGPWEEVWSAYVGLLSWIARRPLVITGPARWLYLADERDTDDPRAYVTQLAWPVRPREEAEPVER